MRTIVFILVFWLTPVLAALAHEAECMTPGGKFVACQVDVLEGQLFVQYAKAKDQERNMKISADKIQRVTQGKSEQHNNQKSLVLGPLMFLQMFDRDQKGQEMFGIDYLGEEGTRKYLLIRIPAGRVYTFGTSLKKLQGEKGSTD